MKPVLTHPSYHDIEKGVGRLAYQIASANIKYDAIVGLSRGGLLPAVILSHMTYRPVLPVAYSSTSGNGDDLNHSNELVDLFEKSILIIDDICDSGRTLAEVREHYIEKGHNVHTAVLYAKENAVMIPDFKWQVIPKDSPWIIFPWES